MWCSAVRSLAAAQIYSPSGKNTVVAADQDILTWAGWWLADWCFQLKKNNRFWPVHRFVLVKGRTNMFGRQINEFSASKLNSKGLIWYDKSEHVDYVPMEMTQWLTASDQPRQKNLSYLISSWVYPPGSGLQSQDRLQCEVWCDQLRERLTRSWLFRFTLHEWIKSCGTGS